MNMQCPFAWVPRGVRLVHKAWRYDWGWRDDVAVYNPAHKVELGRARPNNEFWFQVVHVTVRYSKLVAVRIWFPMKLMCNYLQVNCFWAAKGVKETPLVVVDLGLVVCVQLFQTRSRAQDIAHNVVEAPQTRLSTTASFRTRQMNQRGNASWRVAIVPVDKSDEGGKVHSQLCSRSAPGHAWSHYCMRLVKAVAGFQVCWKAHDWCALQQGYNRCSLWVCLKWIKKVEWNWQIKKGIFTINTCNDHELVLVLLLRYQTVSPCLGTL